jgi:hypothetical protein
MMRIYATPGSPLAVSGERDGTVAERLLRRFPEIDDHALPGVIGGGPLRELDI